MIPAGFEPAPPERSGPRPDALDHSARVPNQLLKVLPEENQTQRRK